VLASTDKLANKQLHAGLLVNVSKAWRAGLEFVQTNSKARAPVAADLTAVTRIEASQISLSTQLRF
jgi:hypothetical protein